MNKEDAVRIALNTFLSEYDGEPLAVFEKLADETQPWHEIEYASVWSPFEHYTVEYVFEAIAILVMSIMGEV
jgi:hypothetical protein